MNNILPVVNQKIPKEEALPPDDTSDCLNRLNKLKDNLKWYKMLLTNGMLPVAFGKGVIEVAKMQESGGNMVLNETTVPALLAMHSSLSARAR